MAGASAPSPRSAEIASSGSKDVPLVSLESIRDAEREFDQLATVLTGKETEANWERRDDALRRLRGIMRAATEDGNAHPIQSWITNPEIVDMVAEGMRTILDDAIACTLSLRTALSTTACNTLSEVFCVLGQNLDSVSEQALAALLKLMGSTKKIVHTAGAGTIADLLSSCTLRPRMMERLVACIDDKNMQIRGYCMRFIYEIMLRLQEDQEEFNSLEHLRFPVLDYCERCIRKGISDSNPQVREVSRDCFFVLSKLSKARADAMHASLDNSSRKALARGPTGSRQRLAGPKPRLAVAASQHRQATASPARPFASISPPPTEVFTKNNGRANSTMKSPMDRLKAVSVSQSWERSTSNTSVAQCCQEVLQEPRGLAISNANNLAVRTTSEASVEVCLDDFDDAVQAADVDRAVQSFTQLTSGGDENEDLAKERQTALRQATTKALESRMTDLVCAALDDPSRLWERFDDSSSVNTSTSQNLAVPAEIVLSLSETALAYPSKNSTVSTRLEACLVEAKRRWGTTWLAILTRSLECASPEEGAVISQWIGEDDNLLQSWMQEVPDQAQRLMALMKDLAPSPLTSLRNLGHTEVPAPVVAHESNVEAAAEAEPAEELPIGDNPVDDLMLSIVDKRVSIGELFRTVAFVRANSNAEDVTSARLLECLRALLEYALQLDSAESTEDSELAAECALTVNNILMLCCDGSGRTSLSVDPTDVLRMLLEPDFQLPATRPLFYWFDLCVQTVLAKDPGTHFQVILERTQEAIDNFSSKEADANNGANCGSQANEERYGACLSYLEKCLGSQDVALLREAGTRSALERVLSVSLRSPSSFVRMVSVQIGVHLMQKMGPQVLDEMVASKAMDPVHKRLVLKVAES